jgi:pimeloyl-ACP methyl ester carboxylesterase
MAVPIIKEFSNEPGLRRKEIKRDSAVINYLVQGSGATTLLFVHGSYIDQTYWMDQVIYFRSKYKVVTIDLPGHGKSGRERTNWSVRGFAEDVNEVIRSLALENIILIGHSLAGDINLMAASSHPGPIIGFIGIDNFKNAATPLPPEYQQQAIAIQQKLKTDFANTNERYARMALLTPLTPAEITDRVVNDYRNACQLMGIATTPEMFNLYQTEKELLPKLPLKLHLINVDYMPTNEEALKQYSVNGYEILHMNGTCHFPMLESPLELNKLLEKLVLTILFQDRQRARIYQL